MKRILILVAALVCAVSPAVARPLSIVVPYGGSRVVQVPQPHSLPVPHTSVQPEFYFNRDYLFYSTDPWSYNFDPAAAAINASNAIYHREVPPSINWVRAATLDRTGESMLQHQLKCQARYPSYDMASDTYLGAHGIPTDCLF